MSDEEEEEHEENLFWELPFRVTDEDAVEWNARLSAFDGKVALELFRHEPGKSVFRDIAAMGPAEAMIMARGLEAMAQKASEQLVDEVHDR